MTAMHQIVILTTHEVSKEGLMAIYEAASKHSSPKDLGPDEFSGGTAFKLAQTVDLPTSSFNGLPDISPQYLSQIYGPFAP